MIDPYTLHREIVVDVPQEKAFRVFTEGFDRWWPREHHIGEADMKQAVLETKPNGRWYEIGEDGSECDWGKVVVWDPPKRLVVTWQLTAQWQYDPDFVTEVEVSFEAKGANQTLVILEHKRLDRYGADWEAIKKSLEADGGWGGLLKLFANEVSKS